MEKDLSKFSHDEVAQLLERAVGLIAIGKIAVREAEYSVNPIPAGEDAVESMEQNAARVGYATNEQEEQAGALVSFRSSLITSDDGVECIAKILASFEVQYAVQPKLFKDPDSLEAFVRVNGVYLAWSYWREFFMNACGRMGIFADMIPLLPSKDAQRVAGYTEENSVKSS